MNDIKYIIVEGEKKGIKKLQLSKMPDSPTIIIIAKRRSGKSWVCRDLLRHFKKIPVGIIIAKSEYKQEKPFYAEFCPDSYIHYEYKSKTIENLMLRQEQMIQKQKDKAKQGKIIDPRAFLLMDDCLSDKGVWAKDQLFYELMYNGRHYKILFILTMQAPLGIKPELRSNFDYFMLLATDIQSDLKKLYEHYAGMFKKLKTFIDVFKQLTKDHGVMIIANCDADADFSDKILWYKASDKPLDKKIGCRQFVDYHLNNYDSKWNLKNGILSKLQNHEY
jgi:Poxvirus A32 protein